MEEESTLLSPHFRVLGRGKSGTYCVAPRCLDFIENLRAILTLKRGTEAQQR